MQLQLTLDIPRLPRPIKYTDSILLIGSCFTEHISERLSAHKFQVLSNPHGILFNPLSVTHSLDSYLQGLTYSQDDLFLLHELWNSWDHHTRFSHTSSSQALAGINASQVSASGFIKKADWVIITLGSAFQYYLVAGARPVANNHRAPAQWFEKRLLGIDHICAAMSNTLEALFRENAHVNVLFTISPVRHIRDGVVDNNRSKARLIESVHELCARYDKAHYFPAYELVMDILRDYRYFDIDFVHPNYLATSYVWEQFVKACIHNDTALLMQQVHDIAAARNHRPRFPETQAHQKFRDVYVQKIKGLQQSHPFLDLNNELQYFLE
ncbi:MAG: GSCFA domain-containing protein [Flavipsychrobacter sp.]|nr:GSCFA domain-containing protein [Flavipsychrobacter sp.]